jgi:hypothetical protein
MYTQLEIKNLRGIDSLVMTGLRPVNLIVGKNNAGKSTLLEAILLMSGATNPELAARVGYLRGQRLGPTSADPLWRPLFKSLSHGNQIELSWQNETSKHRLVITAVPTSRDAGASASVELGIATSSREYTIGGLNFVYKTDSATIPTKSVFDARTGGIDVQGDDPQALVPATFLSARAYSNLTHDAQQFSVLLKGKSEIAVLDALRLIDPRIQRVEVLSEPAGPAVYVDIGSAELIPLAVCGEGTVRMFSIVLAMLTTSRYGVLLVDEIDNGLHYSVMDDFWSLVRALSEKHNVQVFGTTHNEDVIRSAIPAFAHNDAALGLFRIDRRGDRHSVASYTEEAQAAVLEAGFEVRG